MGILTASLIPDTLSKAIRFTRDDHAFLKPEHEHEKDNDAYAEAYDAYMSRYLDDDYNTFSDKDLPEDKQFILTVDESTTQTSTGSSEESEGKGVCQRLAEACCWRKKSKKN